MLNPDDLSITDPPREKKYEWPPAVSLEAARSRLRETGWVPVDLHTYINRHRQTTINLQNWDSGTFEIESPTQIEVSPSDMLETALITFDQRWPDG